jgi:uncharacterized membrane protein
MSGCCTNRRTGRPLRAGHTLRALQAMRLAALLAAASVGHGPAAAGASTDQRGFVSDGIAGGLLFQRCEAQGMAAAAVPLRDRSPGMALAAGITEVRQVMHDPDRPLYVEFRGDVAAAGITALQFQRAIGHVDSCAAVPALPPGTRLWAQGAQPAWRLQSTPSGTRLQVVGKKAVDFKPAVLGPALATGSDAATKARRFEAVPAAGGAPMRIELVEQACNDLGSEAAYGARVVALWGGQRLEGCAARF